MRSWLLLGLYALLIAATVGQPLEQNAPAETEGSERGERVSRQIGYPYSYGGYGGYGGYGAGMRYPYYPYGNLYGSSSLGLAGSGYYGRPYGYGNGYNIGYPLIGGFGATAGGIYGGGAPFAPFA
ncbi:prisilkin-39 [Drosophila miranda]|uniref:prisilkin-39 n=1 Tax=Drosophila miranda TaxID=7229 RepID=UPI0007E5C7F3|nr:prisilkin-39 [Drosophila miranda]